MNDETELPGDVSAALCAMLRVRAQVGPTAVIAACVRNSPGRPFNQEPTSVEVV